VEENATMCDVTKWRSFSQLLRTVYEEPITKIDDELGRDGADV
jgi:hypothetical protein